MALHNICHFPCLQCTLVEVLSTWHHSNSFDPGVSLRSLALLLLLHSSGSGHTRRRPIAPGRPTPCTGVGDRVGQICRSCFPDRINIVLHVKVCQSVSTVVSLSISQSVSTVVSLSISQSVSTVVSLSVCLSVCCLSAVVSVCQLFVSLKAFSHDESVGTCGVYCPNLLG